MRLFVDIETLPTTDETVIASIAAKITAPANYKKAESIAEWERDNKAQAVKDAVAKTSFDGMYGRICCICYAIDDDAVKTVHGDDERSLLEAFYRVIRDVTTADFRGYASDVPLTVVGHNIAGFDLPFLRHRSIIHRVAPPSALIKAMNARPWDGCIADTMLMWSSDREKRVGMDRLCHALGLEGKGDFDGSMVAYTWPVDPGKVVDYCRADVERTRSLYYRMTFDPEHINKTTTVAVPATKPEAQNQQPIPDNFADAGQAVEDDRMFLTESEIRELTGAIQPATQERILREWGLTVFRSRTNKVMVAREAVVRWQLGERPEKARREPVLRLA